MTFSHRVKNEVLANLETEGSVKAFLQGVVLSSFEVYKRYGSLHANYISENVDVLSTVIRELHRVDTNHKITYSIYSKKLKKGRYRQYLHIDGVKVLLDYLEITDGYDTPAQKKEDFSLKANKDTALTVENLLPYIDENNSNFILEQSDIRHFLAGVIVSKGAVADPQKAYHLEISIKDKSSLLLIKSIIESVLNCEVKVVYRKTRSSIYIKEKDAIADMLSVIGAKKNRLLFEEIIVEKHMLNKVTRLCNCDNANIKRVIEASQRQISAIKKIDEYIGLENLDYKLKTVAELRLSNPELNLTELSEIINIDITKSGINHRLKKLEKLAESI